MSENDFRDSAHPVNPILVLGAVYSRKQIDVIFGKNSEKFAEWKAAGLEPLTTGKGGEMFLSDELIAIWKKLRKPKE